MSFSEVSRKIIRPLAVLLARLGVPPNVLTVLFTVLTSAGVFFILTNRPLFAALWFVVFAPFDALDGEVARLSNKTSRFGAFLDSSLDRIVDGLIFLSFIYVFRNDPFLFSTFSAALLSSYTVSYLRARAEGLGVSLREGLMSRYPRFIGVVALLVLWGVWGKTHLTYAAAVYTLLLLFTVLQRLYIAHRRLKTDTKRD